MPSEEPSDFKIILAVVDTLNATVTQMSKDIKELRQEIVSLRQDVDGLRNRLAAIETQEVAQLDFRKTTYQQAADWLKMVNAITWSLGSVFLVAGIIALNGAMQMNDSHWRGVVGVGVVTLSLIWIIVDLVYDRSAVAARKQLVRIEDQWGANLDDRFYTRLSKKRASRGMVWVMLIAAMLAMAYAGLIVAKPGLHFPLEDWVVDVPLRT
jgi:hypothetical protein